MKKKLLTIALVALVALTFALTACQPQQVTLTLYDNDGKTVLSTVKVNKGEAPQKPADPTKDGVTFKGWFITPTSSKPFDFTQPLDEDAAAYAQWQTADYQDSRDWVLVGDMNGWKAAAGYHFAKVANKGNEYTLTIDLDLGDAFKCTVLNSNGVLDYNNATGANVGFAALKNAGDYFEGATALGDAPKNVIAKQAGNYTFTLTTDADNANNALSAVRNGDKIGGNEPDGAITTYYLKGNLITSWKDFIGSTTILNQSATDEKIYTLEIYLPANDEFMFACVVTEDGVTTPGTATIKSVNLDDASKALFEGDGNMKTKEAGLYTFTYNSETSKLSATVNKDYALTAADYYLDGTFDGEHEWGNNYIFKDAYKLIQDANKPHIYTIEHVHLLEGKEFIIQKYKAGSTETGTWGTEGYNGLGKYDYGSLFNGGDNFGPVSKSNQNIKINKTSDYKITLNIYSGMIMIEDENVADDAYIYGTMDGGEWATTADWKMTYNETTKVYTITKSFNVNVEFGIRICVGNTSDQRTFVGKANVSGTPEGFDISGYNIKCTTAGTYTVTLDMSGTSPVITITAAAAQ